MRTTDEALAQLVFDDRHYDWLEDLANKMRAAAVGDQDTYTAHELGVPMECLMQDTEEHTVWLILCGKFGDWTICVNYAWIPAENLIPCAEYIDSICPERSELGE